MSTEEELENIKNGVYDPNFLDSNGNNDLILSVRLSNITHLHNILKKQISNINFANKNGDNVLIESLRYQNFSAAEFIILETNIDLLHKGSNDLTAFSWACHRNNLEIASLLINKNCNIFDITDIDELNKDIYFKKEIITEFFNYKKEVTKTPFRIYEEDEFKIIKRLGSGTYGEVFLALDVNEKEYTIKKNKMCQKSQINENDIIKELVFLKLLNNENVSPYLYGFYVSESCIFLVMEKMKFTFQEFYSMVDFLPEKDKVMEKFIKQSIKCLRTIHSYGIQHNDIKPNNIMISLDNKIKIIDFGIANYLGILPDNEVLKNQKSSIKTYDSFDSRNVSLVVDYYSSGGTMIPSKKFTFRRNRSSYASDIYCLGIIFLNLFSNKKNYDLLLISEGKIYEKKDQIYKKKDYIIPENILSLIENMTKINSLDRATEDELLEYLETGFLKESNGSYLEMMLSKSFSEKDNSMLEKKYLDKMVKKFKNLNFPLKLYKNYIESKMKLIDKILLDEKNQIDVTYDSLISTIISFNENTLELGYSYYSVFSSIFEFQTRNFKYLNTDIFEDINIYPVSIFIEFLSPYDDIKYNIYKEFLKYCILRDISQSENIFTVIKLIILIILKEKEFLDVNIYNENYKNIENIIDSELDFDGYKNLSKLFN